MRFRSAAGMEDGVSIDVDVQIEGGPAVVPLKRKEPALLQDLFVFTRVKGRENTAQNFLETDQAHDAAIHKRHDFLPARVLHIHGDKPEIKFVSVDISNVT